MSAYTLTLRPISIGTYPTAPDPIERVADNYPPIRRDWGNDYGTLRYAEPLPFDRVWRYDLRPCDPVERAHYTFWLHADRDAIRAGEDECMWRAACEEDYRKVVGLAAYNGRAAAALILWEAVWKPNTTP
jgi:hypothetical protein